MMAVVAARELRNGEIVLPVRFDVLKDRLGDRVSGDRFGQRFGACEPASFAESRYSSAHGGCGSEVCHADRV